MTSSPVSTPRPLDRFGILLVILLCASWGLNQVTAKVALAEIPPMIQASGRSLLGGLLVLAYALKRDPRLFDRDGTLPAGLFAGAFFALEFIALYLGLQWTHASRAVLFLYSAPFAVAAGLPFITADERLRPLQWAGLLLSFVGLALAMGVSTGGDRQFLGDVLCFLAGLCWAATTLIMKGSALSRARPEKSLLYQLGVSAVVIGLVAAALGERMPTSLSPLAALSFGYQVVWVIGFTFVAWFWMVKTYRAGELSAFTFLTPLFGVAASHFLLGDPVPWKFIAASALVAAGILLVSLPQPRR